MGVEAEAGEPWIVLRGGEGKSGGRQSLYVTPDADGRLFVSIDWSKAKAGENRGVVELSGGGKTVSVAVRAVTGEAPQSAGRYFGNVSGSEVSIPASGFSRNLPGESASWAVLPGLGRGEACMGAADVCSPSAEEESARRATLEYQVLLPDTNVVTLCIGILPTQDVQPERGLRLAVAVDGGQPLVLDARQGFVDTFSEYTPANLALSENLKPLPKPEASIRLLGTGEQGQNVWVEVDGKPKGIDVINNADNQENVRPMVDLVFCVDNSGSMSEEANAIARDIISWASLLESSNIDVRFGCVGYGNINGVNGAINLTDADALSEYLNRSTGTSRTMGFAGSDANTLQTAASNFGYTNGECGGQAIRFGDRYMNFRTGSNRIYVNFTDEPNQPGNELWSTEFFKSQDNWSTTQGTVHTVYSASSSMSESIGYREKPWRISLR